MSVCDRCLAAEAPAFPNVRYVFTICLCISPDLRREPRHYKNVHRETHMYILRPWALRKGWCFFIDSTQKLSSSDWRLLMAGLGRRPVQAPSLAAPLPVPQPGPSRHRRSKHWGTMLSRTATFALFAGAYYLVLTRYACLCRENPWPCSNPCAWACLEVTRNTARDSMPIVKLINQGDIADERKREEG